MQATESAITWMGKFWFPVYHGLVHHRTINFDLCQFIAHGARLPLQATVPGMVQLAWEKGLEKMMMLGFSYKGTTCSWQLCGMLRWVGFWYRQPRMTNNNERQSDFCFGGNEHFPGGTLEVDDFRSVVNIISFGWVASMDDSMTASVHGNEKIPWQS